jgi:hypothetical protein
MRGRKERTEVVVDLKYFTYKGNLDIKSIIIANM